MDMSAIQQIDNRTAVSSANKSVPETEPFWGKDGFTFGDVLDIFNPLQHLPFISKHYRDQADDDACEGSKIIGGVLFGGLFGGIPGVLSSITNSAIRHETHQDVSEHLLEIADESLDFIETPAIKQEIKPQSIADNQVLTNNDTINPFFAQILDEYSNEQAYLSSMETVSAQRSREWGKV